MEQSNPTSNGSLAETINDIFVSVSAHLSAFDSLVLDGMQQDFSDKYIIDPTEIERPLLHLNLHKSPGPDGSQAGYYEMWLHC